MWFQNPWHPKGQTQHSTRHYSLIPPKTLGPAIKQPHTKRLIICVISFGLIKIDRLSAFMKYFLKAHIPLIWGLLFRFGFLHIVSGGDISKSGGWGGPDKNFRGEFWGQVPSISHYRSTPWGHQSSIIGTVSL